MIQLRKLTYLSSSLAEGRLKLGSDLQLDFLSTTPLLDVVEGRRDTLTPSRIL